VLVKTSVFELLDLHFGLNYAPANFQRL